MEPKGSESLVTKRALQKTILSHKQYFQHFLFPKMS